MVARSLLFLFVCEYLSAHMVDLAERLHGLEFVLTQARVIAAVQTTTSTPWISHKQQGMYIGTCRHDEQKQPTIGGKDHPINRNNARLTLHGTASIGTHASMTCGFLRWRRGLRFLSNHDTKAEISMP